MSALFAVLVGGAVADVVAGFFDESETEKGIVKGVAVEGNEVIVTIAHSNKPKGIIIDAYNLTITAILFGAGLGFSFTSVNALSYAFAGALAASAGKHVVEAHKWISFLNGANPNAPKSAWQKFLGL